MSLELSSSYPNYLSANFRPNGGVTIGPEPTSPNYPADEDGPRRSQLGPDVDIKLWGKGRWTGKKALRASGYVISAEDMRWIFITWSHGKAHNARIHRKRRAAVHAKRARRNFRLKTGGELLKLGGVRRTNWPTFPEGADVALCPGL